MLEEMHEDQLAIVIHEIECLDSRKKREYLETSEDDIRRIKSDHIELKAIDKLEIGGVPPDIIESISDIIYTYDQLCYDESITWHLKTANNMRFRIYQKIKLIKGLKKFQRYPFYKEVAEVGSDTHKYYMYCLNRNLYRATIILWNGKFIDSMSRDEIINAIIEISKIRNVGILKEEFQKHLIRLRTSFNSMSDPTLRDRLYKRIECIEPEMALHQYPIKKITVDRFTPKHREYLRQSAPVLENERRLASWQAKKDGVFRGVFIGVIIILGFVVIGGILSIFDSGPKDFCDDYGNCIEIPSR
jgi:hypothetical protein